jgi:catechol 2,3-dioxygenase-like lactoylglutathione lyase family enzyme
MLKAIRHLDYVILLCEDIPRMKRFYHEVMGFPLYRDWGEWVEMRVGSVLLTLRRRGRPYDGQHTAGAASVQLAFRVTPDEVDSCYTELVEKGVTILESPQVRDFGHKTLFFTDPEGNVLEIYADVTVKPS